MSPVLFACFSGRLSDLPSLQLVGLDPRTKLENELLSIGAVYFVGAFFRSPAAGSGSVFPLRNAISFNTISLTHRPSWKILTISEPPYPAGYIGAKILFLESPLQPQDGLEGLRGWRSRGPRAQQVSDINRCDQGVTPRVGGQCSAPRAASTYDSFFRYLWIKGPRGDTRLPGGVDFNSCHE